jgi:GNAT superfamily N-acetyltransferase
MHYECQNPPFFLSTDPDKLDLKVIHQFLSEESYWAENITYKTVQDSIDDTLCFGLYVGEEQVGFGRMVTDLATFAYLSDVFVLKEYRGKGAGKWMMEKILEYPGLKKLRRLMLITEDAQDFYRQFGFEKIKNEERYMEKVLIAKYPKKGK